jgi:hypothetical protein
MLPMMTELDHAVCSVYENAIDTLLEQGYDGETATNWAPVGAYESASVFAPDFGFTEEELEDAVAKQWGKPTAEHIAEYRSMIK